MEDFGLLAAFSLVVTIALIGLSAGIVNVLPHVAYNPRVAHRIICDYEGGLQKGDVCVKDGRVIKIDISSFQEDKR